MCHLTPLGKVPYSPKIKGETLPELVLQALLARLALTLSGTDDFELNTDGKKKNVDKKKNENSVKSIFEAKNKKYT